jgi:hypothetical protein
MVKRTQHSQGWHELQQLSKKTHIEETSMARLLLSCIGQGILFTLGFFSFIGIIAYFN